MNAIPSAIVVLDSLQAIGSPSTALALCQHLQSQGWEKAGAQLAIQRTVDGGHIVFNSDWTLSMSETSPAYAGTGMDRFGRSLTTPAWDIAADAERFVREWGFVPCDSDGNPKGEKPQALSAKHDSAGPEAIAQGSTP